MALTESDKKYLTSILQQEKVQSLVFLQNRRPESSLFSEFLQTCQELAPELTVTTEVIDDTELPGLRLGENWRFCAVPEGKKLEMLGEILLAQHGQGQELSQAVKDRWEKLPVAPKLTMFIAPQCPFCPQMVRQLIPLTIYPPKAAIDLIDASLFYETARNNEIKAVPTVIVNEVYRLTGNFQVSELLDLAEKTDPAHLPVAVLERMMVEGQASVLGDMMLAGKKIFANVLPLLLHPEINIRLGAMVALETVGEERPDLIADILPKLWQNFHKRELAVQGDLIYLIGEWGDKTWIEPLTQIRSEVDEPDIQEALEEALEKLQVKGRALH
jgi:glutaredoxin